MKNQPRKKDSVARATNIPPPPPAFRMIDKMIDLFPKIQKNQDLLIRYYKSESKDLERLNESLAKAAFGLPVPWPPSFPMMDDAINLLPKVVTQQKDIRDFIKRRVAAATKLLNDFEKVGGAPVRARKGNLNKPGK